MQLLPRGEFPTASAILRFSDSVQLPVLLTLPIQPESTPRFHGSPAALFPVLPVLLHSFHNVVWIPSAAFAPVPHSSVPYSDGQMLL